MQAFCQADRGCLLVYSAVPGAQHRHTVRRAGVCTHYVQFLCLPTSSNGPMLPSYRSRPCTSWTQELYDSCVYMHAATCSFWPCSMPINYMRSHLPLSMHHSVLAHEIAQWNHRYSEEKSGAKRIVRIMSASIRWSKLEIAMQTGTHLITRDSSGMTALALAAAAASPACVKLLLDLASKNKGTLDAIGPGSSPAIIILGQACAQHSSCPCFEQAALCCLCPMAALLPLHICT